MPIKKKWTKLTKENVSKLPEARGHYELGYKTNKGIEAGHPGQTNNLRRRMKEHLREENKKSKG